MTRTCACGEKVFSLSGKRRLCDLCGKFSRTLAKMAAMRVEIRTVPAGCELWDTGVGVWAEPRSPARHEPISASRVVPATDPPLSVVLDRQMRRIRSL